MKLRIVKANKYSGDELKRLDRVLDLFLSSVNSIEFKEKILAHERFLTKQNLTNQQVYNRIMDGDELHLNEGNDQEADLDLSLDLRNSTDAIGFTKAGRIFTFRNMFHDLSTTKLAGHYAHEYCHTLGFADPADMDDIHLNVPYQVGSIIEEISQGASTRTFVSGTLPIPEGVPIRLADLSNTLIAPESSLKPKRKKRLRKPTRKRKARRKDT